MEAGQEGATSGVGELATLPALALPKQVQRVSLTYQNSMTGPLRSQSFMIHAKRWLRKLSVWPCSRLTSVPKVEYGRLSKGKSRMAGGV
jgi:hypothetical protein